VATLYQFRCDPCGYEAKVSGDRDCGMASATVTILCENCRELFEHFRLSGLSSILRAHHANSAVTPSRDTVRLTRRHVPTLRPSLSGLSTSHQERHQAAQRHFFEWPFFLKQTSTYRGTRRSLKLRYVANWRCSECGKSTRIVLEVLV
jgi:hypothetical protein